MKKGFCLPRLLHLPSLLPAPTFHKVSHFQMTSSLTQHISRPGMPERARSNKNVAKGTRKSFQSAVDRNAFKIPEIKGPFLPKQTRILSSFWQHCSVQSQSLSLRLSEMKNDASPTFASFAAFGREMVGLSYRDAQFE